MEQNKNLKFKNSDDYEACKWVGKLHRGYFNS